MPLVFRHFFNVLGHSLPFNLNTRLNHEMRFSPLVFRSWSRKLGFKH